MWETVAARSPSVSSSTPVTVTVCGVAQSSGVKVSDAGAASSVRDATRPVPTVTATATGTSRDGFASSTTV